MPIKTLRDLQRDVAFEEKEDWHTTVCERLKIDPNLAIEYVIQQLSEDGYEEMNVMK